MLKPETSVEHLDQAMRMLTAAIQSPERTDRESLLAGCHANLAAIWNAEVRCNCHATYKSRHLVSCPVRHVA
jgi:hypothetical protein